jgi:hypothetical protein
MHTKVQSPCVAATFTHYHAGIDKITKKSRSPTTLKGTATTVKEPTVLVEPDTEPGDRSPPRKTTKILLPIHSIIRTMTLPQPVAAKRLGVSISTL